MIWNHMSKMGKKKKRGILRGKKKERSNARLGIEPSAWKSELLSIVGSST